jgi:predicted phage terminase large subunit-like protein
MDSQTVKELKVAKYLCQTSSLFFTRYFFKHRYSTKFIVGDHHKIIADTLDQVLEGKLKKVMINIAPRYGKTEVAVKNFMAQGLGINPASKFIHLSYSDDLALDNSEEVKDIVKSEAYRRLFNVQVKPGSDSKKKWYTTASGGVYATSAAGQVTGFGAGRVDPEDIDEEYFAEGGNTFAGALIIDDPIKPEDADSDTIRERVNQRYQSTIKNRVNSRNTPIIIVMQRLHENDLCGFLLDAEPGEWTVISLPCIVDEGKETERALWPHKHTLEELKKMQAVDKRVGSPSFQRQYQQNPMAQEGLLFKESELQYFVPSDLLEKSYESVLGYVDVADEGVDHTSAGLGKNIGADIYLTEVVFSILNSDHTIPMVADMIKRNKVPYTRVESNSMGAIYGRELQKAIGDELLIYPSHSTTNKHTRILMDAAFIKRHCKFIHPEHQNEEYRQWYKQVTTYRKDGTSKKDDAPDQLSGLANFIRGYLSHLYQ